MVLAIDFDHVICDRAHPDPDHKMGPPMRGCGKALRKLKAQGHWIIIHSCNRPEAIRRWMGYFDLPYTEIWAGMGKPVADCYIDDAAIRFENWSQVMDELEVWDYKRDWGTK